MRSPHGDTRAGRAGTQTLPHTSCPRNSRYLFHCYLLSLSLFSFWFSPLVDVLLVLVGGAGGGYAHLTNLRSFESHIHRPQGRDMQTPVYFEFQAPSNTDVFSQRGVEEDPNKVLALLQSSTTANNLECATGRRRGRSNPAPTSIYAISPRVFSLDVSVPVDASVH